MKRTVEAKIDGASNADVTVAGGIIADNVQPGSNVSTGADTHVKVEASNLRGGTYEVAGLDVLHFADQVTEPLDKLAEILAQNLSQRDQIQDLRELVTQIKEQAEKPKPSRNSSKVKRLLNGLGSYLGLATLAATQAENAQKLFEMVKGLLEI